MKISINYFGQLATITGTASESREVAGGADARTLLSAVAAQYGDGAKRIILDDAGNLRPSLIVMVNGAVIDKGKPLALKDGDAVSLLPAIAGG
jgi:MoaD family protein